MPSRSFKGEESSNKIGQKRLEGEDKKEDGVMEEYGNNESQGKDKRIKGCNNSRNIRFIESKSNGPHIEATATLKSNLKKTTTSIAEANQQRRKVTWPDAHGKDIAHILEFEPRYCSNCIIYHK